MILSCAKCTVEASQVSSSFIFVHSADEYSKGQNKSHLAKGSDLSPETESVEGRKP